jgi:alanyl-tRNA synthetase
MISANEIRSLFLDFFRRNGHTIVSSSSLVPREDPSLLFTNAGMVQFKKVFLGQDKRDYNRATTSQKCLRVGGKHNDLENVGRTARHHTFFEMLGNFSFGDYFKEQAIEFAWTLLTKELGLPKDKLHATVFREDDEAIGLWKKVADLPANRIHRLGEKDNFWSMGDTGPCGPCSEILVDQGEAMSCGPNCGIGSCDCDRFLEVWNLVFMQYDQIEPGKRVGLPRPSIDTGMGLERIAAVCQGVHSNFDSDLFSPIMAATAELAGVKYRQHPEVDTALRVIADHCRSMVFLIADSIMPSNEGRGYVLRRLIRRAFRFGRLMGLKDPFLHRVAPSVVELMGQAYPEIQAGQDFMTRVVREEEERFSTTLDKGLEILEEEMAKAKTANSPIISGEAAFKLYDTYGFPLDIIADVAGKQGFTVDEDGYKACMAEQKTRAKKAWKGSGETDLAGRFKKLLEAGLKSRFVGYEDMETASRITALLGEDGLPRERIIKGEGGFAVFASTPFYGESGGQSGDQGLAETLTGSADVLDTLKPATELTTHKVFVNEGELLLDQEVRLNVDQERRLATARNHTTTHLLQAALRKVLGEHVKQAGSMVTPERLRFDFTHISPLTPAETAQVEQEVNQAILGDLPVSRRYMDYKQAVGLGAMALFGEKYGNEVCVVQVPDVSTELCGGTHLRATGQAGGFMVVSESGVAAGVRRIEGATGLNFLAQAQASRRELDEISGLLRSRPGELAAKIAALQAQIKALGKDKENLSAKLASGQGSDLMDAVKLVAGVKVLTAKMEGANAQALRQAMDDVRSKLTSGVACLASQTPDGKAALILYVSPDLHGKFTAKSLIADVAALVGGSGGGRPDMAQAGGTEPEGIEAALAKVAELISK